jgi:prepilin-type N-terminal cleavage/methylation domain-containing protein
MKTKLPAGFTLIEMLVVIAIIATIAAFAVPALTSAMAKGQMTGTMNNARQLYLAGYQMALDGGTNSDGNRAWPGDYAIGICDTLQQYCQWLVQNDYLKGGDAQKVLSAPGAACTVAVDNTVNPPTVALSGRSGLKIYKVKDSDPSTTIFAVSSNYTYNTALTGTNTPYGDKGFIVIHKGGDAAVFRKNNATASNYSGGAAFQAAIGTLTGDADGTPSGDDNGKNLTNP